MNLPIRRWKATNMSQNEIEKKVMNFLIRRKKPTNLSQHEIGWFSLNTLIPQLIA